jgi:pantoate--beta-alanine ligase
LRAAGFDGVDYVAVRDAETLSPIDRVTKPARALAAARLGRVRLIDNLPVPAR